MSDATERMQEDEPAASEPTTDDAPPTTAATTPTTTTTTTQQHMQADGVTPLPSPSEQAALIKDLDTGANKVELKEGDTWYLIDAKWVRFSA